MLLAHLLFKSMPESVRELVENRALLNRLGFRAGRSISDGQTRFVLEEFAGAAARAMRGETSTIEALGEDSEEFVFSPDRVGGFQYMGPDGTPRQAAPEFQVLSDDPVVQKAALDRYREHLDLPSAEVERVMADLILSAPTQRLLTLNKAVAHSTSSFYRRLNSQLRNRERLPYDELLPKDPTSVLHHLRLRPGEQGEFSGRWETATKAAVAELPLRYVLERVLGLPVPIPRALVNRLRASTAEEVRQLVSERLPIQLTPVSAIASLQLLMALADQVPWCGRLGRGLARRLLGAGWQDDFRTFGAVLHWTEHEFRGRLSFTQLMPVERLAVVWYHAHRLYSAFRALTGAAQIEEMFRPSPGRVSASLFDRAPNYWNDRAHPRHYAPLRFTLSGVVAASDNPELLPLEALHRTLRRLLERRPEGVQPALELFRNLSRTHNGLGAYLMPNPEEFAPYTGAVISVDSTAQLTEACREALARIGDEPLNAEPWRHLIVILGDQAVDPALAPEFHRTAGSADLISLAETNEPLFGLALSILVTHYAAHGTAEERDAFQERMRLLAERRAGVGAGGEQFEAIDWALIEATARLSAAGDSPEESIRVFARRLEELVSSSPRLGVRSLHAVQRFCFELPIHLAEVFTPLLTRLRASVASLN